MVFNCVQSRDRCAVADSPTLALNPRCEGWHRIREFTELCCCLGNSICKRVQANEPCHGGADTLKFCFPRGWPPSGPQHHAVRQTHEWHLRDVGWHSKHSVVPCRRRRNPLEIAMASQIVRGRALCALEEAQKSLKFCVGNSLAAGLVPQNTEA